MAPSDSVYSTAPVSYPFYENYYHGMPKAYAWMQGTSQATAYVAGAAARTWSVNPAYTAAQIKARLKESGTQRSNRMQFAVDPNADNPDQGYNTGIMGRQDNEPGYRDEFWTPAGEHTVRAPFCWPTQGGGYQSHHDMSEVTYLNVASAMNRFGVGAYVTDSRNALPLTGATVSFFNGGTTGATNVALGSGIIPPGNEAMVFLTNQVVPAVPTHYKTNVNKTGYTAGSQKVLEFVTYPEIAGWMWFDNVIVPPLSNNLEVTLTWYSGSRLGMMLWLPEQTSPDPLGIQRDGVVSPMYLPDYQPAFPGFLSLEEGTLATTAQTGIPEEPFAQIIHDGVNNGENISSLVIRGVPVGTTYSRPYYPGTYSLYVTDFSRHYDSSTYQTNWPGLNTSNWDYFSAPVVNIWSRGKLRKTYTLDFDPDGGPSSSCSTGDKDLWHVGDITWNGTSDFLFDDDPAGWEECASLENNGRGGFDYVPYPGEQSPRILETYPRWDEMSDPLQSLVLLFNRPVTTETNWHELTCDSGSGMHTINTVGDGIFAPVIEIFPEPGAQHVGDTCELSVFGDRITAGDNPPMYSEGRFLRYHVADLPPEYNWSEPWQGMNLGDLTLDFTIKMSEPVDMDSGWAGLSCSDGMGGSTDVVVNAGPVTDALQLPLSHAALPPNTNCMLTLFADKIRESDTTIPGDQLNMAENRTIHFTTFQEL